MLEVERLVLPRVIGYKMWASWPTFRYIIKEVGQFLNNASGNRCVCVVARGSRENASKISYTMIFFLGHDFLNNCVYKR